MVKIIKVFVFVIFATVSSYGQTYEQEQFIKLYKENYIEWISSPEIAKMQERDPELKQIINAIPIQETNAFKEAFKKAEMERGQDSVQDITAMLGDGAFDVSMDIIKEFLAKENTDIIINMYWQVIKSEKSSEIVDLIMPHIQRAREEFERTGVEIATTMRKTN